MQPIYLDHNATTPVRSEVIEAMARCYGEIYANPASQHRPGQQARKVLEDAREQIAQVLDVDLSPPRRDRLIFTSGGTEANNLAILGIARAGGSQPGQIIISAGEHQSVIEPAEHLLEQGWRLDTLGLTPQGVVRVEQLPRLLDSHAPSQICLVSVQLGNHETGVLQPVEELAALCNAAGVPLHTDAIQVVGKLPVSFRSLGVAAMSIAAHKFGGPLGIGALIVRSDVPLLPLMFGGSQQSGLRPGTESAALAVGMATALGLWQKEQDEYARRLRSLRDRFETGLQAALPNIVIHGRQTGMSAPLDPGMSVPLAPGMSAPLATPRGTVPFLLGQKSGQSPAGQKSGQAPPPDPRLPQTSNIAFPGIEGQVLLMALDLAGVACSVGSACASGSTELSPTLRAMDLCNDLVASSLRFSFGATNTDEEVDEAVRRIVQMCRELGAPIS